MNLLQKDKGEVAKKSLRAAILITGITLFLVSIPDVGIAGALFGENGNAMSLVKLFFAILLASFVADIVGKGAPEGEKTKWRVIISLFGTGALLIAEGSGEINIIATAILAIVILGGSYFIKGIFSLFHIGGTSSKGGEAKPGAPGVPLTKEQKEIKWFNLLRVILVGAVFAWVTYYTNFWIGLIATFAFFFLLNWLKVAIGTAIFLTSAVLILIGIAIYLISNAAGSGDWNPFSKGVSADKELGYSKVTTNSEAATQAKQIQTRYKQTSDADLKKKLEARYNLIKKKFPGAFKK